MSDAATPDAPLPMISAVAVESAVMDPTPTQPIDMKSLIRTPAAVDD
jgi:hypothetical protein